jgi:hypothetical protein
MDQTAINKLYAINKKLTDHYQLIGSFPDLVEDNKICNLYLHKKTKQTIIFYTYLNK